MYVLNVGSNTCPYLLWASLTSSEIENYSRAQFSNSWKRPQTLCEMIRQDAVLVGRPPWVAAAGGQLPRFGCWQEHLPGLWRAWHTWDPPLPRPRRPDLELAGACQLPDQNQYTRRLPKFQVQRSPHVGAVGRLRQMGNFWVAASMLDGRPPFRLAALSARCRPSSRCLGGGAPVRRGHWSPA